MKILTAIIVLLFLNSCFSSRMRIDNRIEATTDRIKLIVVVSGYDSKQGEYYGTIQTANNTTDTLFFNFNQAIIVSQDTIRADYNIKPMSYAKEAFYIQPLETKTWDVAWRIERTYQEYREISILPDTNVIKI